jgi:5'-phosphate synthase pdxT subunit
MRVGVLALQGGFAAHARAVSELGHEATLVRSVRDLHGVRALVLPGGESTVMLDLLSRDPALERALIELVREGAPVLATCAGLILIARRVHDPEQRSLAWIDVEVRRNARGRQLHSSEARDDDDRLSLVSIRAPRITSVGENVEVLATLDREPVLVRQGHIVAATFHPELTTDLSVHALALDGTPLPHGSRDSTNVPRAASTPLSGVDTSSVGLASAIR